MPRQKIKFALRIYPETMQQVKEFMDRDNCQTQNEFIEKAIRFYVGYLSGNEAGEYLPQALVDAFRATLRDSENHISRLLFKLAVEVVSSPGLWGMGSMAPPGGPHRRKYGTPTSRFRLRRSYGVRDRICPKRRGWWLVLM